MNTMNINILCVAINVKPAVAAVQEDMPQIEPACFGAMSRGFADEPKAWKPLANNAITNKKIASQKLDAIPLQTKKEKNI